MRVKDWPGQAAGEYSLLNQFTRGEDSVTCCNPGQESPSPQGSGRWPPGLETARAPTCRCSAARPCLCRRRDVRRARTGRTAAARLHCTFQRNPRTALLEKAATRRVGHRPWPLPAIPSRFRRGRGCRIRWLVLRKNAETGCGAPSRARWCCMSCFRFGPWRPKIKYWASWWRPGRV